MDLEVQTPMPGLKVRRRIGRTERAAHAAVRAARKESVLETTDVGAISALYAAARAVDSAELGGDVYAAPQAVREYRASLADLLLTPASRKGGNGDDADAWLASLGAPALRDTPGS
jgi:hypothetical protein